MKVLWFSRHEMTESQKEALQKACNEEIEVQQINKTINSAYEIQDDIEKNDIIAIVAPINLQQQFLKLAGEKPVIMAVNDRVLIPQPDGKEDKVGFNFVKWEKLLSISIKKEDFNSINKQTQIDTNISPNKENTDDKEIKKEKKWVPYGTNKILDNLVDNSNSGVRYVIACQGYGLDVLINDEYPWIRQEVARQGYGLDILIDDEDFKVRSEVASQGYGLDKLVNDEDWWVREEVARQGYGLDILIDDEEGEVREAVASQCYGLDTLINDEDWEVRSEVASQGYGLDKLINDEDECVRAEVARQGYGLDILINDKDSWVRQAVADQGYELDILINDADEDVRFTVEGYLKDHNLTLEEWKQTQIDVNLDTNEEAPDFQGNDEEDFKL